LPAEPFLRCHTDANSQQRHDILCESKFNIMDFVVRAHREQTWGSGGVPCTHVRTQQGDKEDWRGQGGNSDWRGQGDDRDWAGIR